MTDEPRIADPTSYYDDLGEGEWDRLASGLAGELEFENTIAHLERRLPHEGHVLDAGGGAGRYAAWLRNHGYDVTLLDVSSGRLEIAQEKVGGPNATTGFLRGSIHRLPFDDGRFDATICLGGPLSHLVDEERRRAAASELRRVTEPDGPVFVSIMGLSTCSN